MQWSRWIIAFLAVVGASPAAAVGLLFSSPSLEEGLPLSAGAVYRYSDVTAGVDALLTIDAVVNSATLERVGDTIEGDLVISLRGWGDSPDPGPSPSYGAFTLAFVVADTMDPVELSGLTFWAYDIDSSLDFDYSETLWVPDSLAASLPAATNLEVLPGEGVFAGFREVTLVGVNNTLDDDLDPDSTTLPHAVRISSPGASSISFRWGLTGSMSVVEDDNGKNRDLLLRGDETGFDLCPGSGDSDIDGLCDESDPCLVFFNLLPLIDRSGDTVPDECQCGDGDGNGSINALDIGVVAQCANGVVACDSTIVDTDHNLATNALDIGGVAQTANGVLEAYSLRCQRRPEGTPPPGLP